MENSGVFEDTKISDVIVESFNDESMQFDISKASENPGDDLLEDLDSYLEVINDRLTVSRMVNDSVTKGIVNAVKEEAKQTLCEWKQEQEFREEFETLVIQNTLKSLQNQFERKLQEERSLIHRNPGNKQLMKTNELLSLREELDAISRSLSSYESGSLFSHGLLEGGEESKKKDRLYKKVQNLGTPNSITERNGKHEEANRSRLETMDPVLLKNMSKEELLKFCKTEMANTKRNDETIIQEITEKYYTLRREILNSCDPSSPLRREKEFDSLRKKIPEVISKLDSILVESEKLPVACDNTENVHELNNKLTTLLSENCKLKDLLSNKKKEAKDLSSQVSDLVNKMSNHSLAEANLLNQIRKLKSEVEDTRIEFSLREEIHKCVIQDLNCKIKQAEDLLMESIAMQDLSEIVLMEAAKDPKGTIEYGVEDSDMESIIMQEICAIISLEAIKDAQLTVDLLKMEHERANENRVSLETLLFESEKALSIQSKENEQLKQELVLLSASVEEKEKMALEAESRMMKEKEQFELICQELNTLRDRVGRRDILISESNKMSDQMKNQLEEASHQIRLYEKQVSSLDQKLTSAVNDLKDANEERRQLHENVKQKQNIISSLEEREIEQKKQTESILITVQRFSKALSDFEQRASDKVKKNNLRLENLHLHCRPLFHKSKSFKGMELIYKQKLERKKSDLRKAEEEVDLLGDEVDALLGVLEKIYIALDHYSPVLQHYPGVMEILKLVRRELSGENSKPVY
ncbi:hypothetical protein MKW92_014168 [Papaver armeniacum]|nr:hypothetical protein MKW92_014168 [Papaver armeniacum]